MRTVDELESFAATVPPMAYDIANYASLGLLWRTLKLDNPDQPDRADMDTVINALEQSLADILNDPQRGLAGRLGAPNRTASARVREELRRQWTEPEPQAH
jgi:malonate decarboxylase gamma subunit